MLFYLLCGENRKQTIENYYCLFELYKTFKQIITINFYYFYFITM